MKELFGRPKMRKDGTPGKQVILDPPDILQRSPHTADAWIRYSTYDAEATWLLWDLLRRRLQMTRWSRTASLYEYYVRYLAPFGELLTDVERCYKDARCVRLPRHAGLCMIVEDPTARALKLAERLEKEAAKLAAEAEAPLPAPDATTSSCSTTPTRRLAQAPRPPSTPGATTLCSTMNRRRRG